MLWADLSPFPPSLLLNTSAQLACVFLAPPLFFVPPPFALVRSAQWKEYPASTGYTIMPALRGQPLSAAKRKTPQSTQHVSRGYHT
eukprot:3460908-Rhodomonas_salina.2